MANPSQGRASLWTQANALLRKNIVYQRRNKRANIILISFPLLLCILLIVLQMVINNELNKAKYRCGCAQVNGTTVCGIQYSTPDQAVSCPIPSPPKWPALIQVPAPQYRASRTDFIAFSDLPSESCRQTGSCPVTTLVTGNNQTFGLSLAQNLLPVSPLNSSDILGGMANNVLGSASYPDTQNFLDPAFSSGLPLYVVQPRCRSSMAFPVSIPFASSALLQEVACAQGLYLWRNSSSDINDELYKGYRKGNPEKRINEIVAAYDFLDSNMSSFNVSLWYNSTFKNDTGFSAPALIRIPRLVNLVSNAYLKLLLGPSVEVPLEFVKEMPKPGTRLRLDISSLLSAQFFTYVIMALFPTVLTALVYEKQQRLRIMMKMHGLGDAPYWIISYAYFLAISLIYMICFVIFGSAIGKKTQAAVLFLCIELEIFIIFLNFIFFFFSGLKIFTLNDYSLQFIFYFIYINLQISMAFLVSPVFSNVLTTRAVGYLLTFGSGLLGEYLFQFFVQDTSFPRGWIIIMELYPGFSLFRGLYELGQYSFLGDYMGSHGMRWSNLSDSTNGMGEVLIIMAVEWLIVLPVAFYINQVASSGSGVKKNPLFFLHSFRKRQKSYSGAWQHRLQRQESKVSVEMEKADVAQERERIEQLLSEPSLSDSIICDNLQKIYPGRDGNPPKLAVKGLSLAVPRGECFGMLGPNGAGKTSFISMMIGLMEPTAGTAFIEGLDIRTQMDEIYTSMGVCPQHDLLWETLTGREHLLFYGRLKNLKGSALLQAVDESLKSVNLYHGGVGDKPAGKYSGGMKRRLSVAISLIGNPKAVYMDEPSTGLDPASRNNLWNVVKQAKQHRAIILTTHSMEEAEVLCDRIGIFVDGSLQCIGNPKQLKARYGGSFVFTMATSLENDAEVERMVRELSPNAQKIYHISGTQKFEMPKEEVRIADVFRAVENAKKRFTVHAWGVADTTLEDVFIKVAREAQPSAALS